MTLALAHIALGSALGVGLGLLHFATLKKVTALYLGRAPARALALQLLRLALLTVLLAALAMLGAGALVAGALGILAGREIVLRRARKEA